MLPFFLMGQRSDKKGSDASQTTRCQQEKGFRQNLRPQEPLKEHMDLGGNRDSPFTQGEWGRAHTGTTKCPSSFTGKGKQVSTAQECKIIKILKPTDAEKDKEEKL